MHLLHLEDSAQDGALVEFLVRTEWPECELRRVVTRAEYTRALSSGDFQLILSDYTLPDFDGLSALQLARQQCPDKPFIFLSGTIGEERAIEALKCGAADYVLKDRPNRIVPAIRLALQRSEEAEQRRRSEVRLSEQAVLLERARDAICVMDETHRVTYWNASAERLFGWSRIEALGRDLRDLIFPGSAAFDEAGRHVHALGEWQGELEPRAKHGAALTIESRWTLVAAGGGAVPQVLLINTDITDKKRLEARFLRAQRMDSIGTLAGGVAHDLNNVLNPIILAAGLLRREALNGPARELVGSIEAGAQHGAALIKQLLAFARGVEGVQVELAIPQLTAGLGPLLQPVLPRNVHLVIHADEGVWAVKGDATQVNRALLNLCINARDAMPDGGRIGIVAENFTVDDALAGTLLDGRPGRYVRISVTDTGTGIAPEIRDRIFEPFFTTKPVGKGTGLGLCTVRGVVKGHGGCLQVESEVGHGTAVRLFLPALARPSEAFASVPASPSGSARPFARGSGESVLIIDDDHAVRNILKLLLEGAGYRVFSAGNGPEGIAEFERHRDEVEVVITDMMMPEMNGPEVIAALRRLRPELKAIAISGLMEMNSARVQHLPGPAIECLSKPITAKELFAAIERALRPAA